MLFRRQGRRRAIVLAVALVAVISAVACVILVRRDIAPASVDDRCADVIVLGVRGSGQSLAANDGLGKEVHRAVDHLTGRLADDDRSVEVWADPYRTSADPTLEIYGAEVDNGSRLLAVHLREVVRDCEDSDIALVGFSEGAQVVHQVGHDLSEHLARRVRLVAMIADPRRNADDDIAHESLSGESATGNGTLGAGVPFGPATRDSAVSFCVPGDEICGEHGGDVTKGMSSTHRTFYEQPAEAVKIGNRMYEVLTRGEVGP